MVTITDLRVFHCFDSMYSCNVHCTFVQFIRTSQDFNIIIIVMYKIIVQKAQWLSSASFTKKKKKRKKRKKDRLRGKYKKTSEQKNNCGT